MLRPIFVAAAFLATTALPAGAQEQTVAVTLRPALDRPSTTFEGWGTALAWFADVTGGWPAAERERLADLFCHVRYLRRSSAPAPAAPSLRA